MRFCTFLLALVIGAASAAGQETFAPLITDNTVMFVHVDLQKAEIDTVKQNWKTYTEGLLKALRFEESSLKSALSALDKDFDKLDAYIRPAFETITQKLGIKEIALIADTELCDCVIVCAVPWKDKTDTDLQTLKTLFSWLPEDWEIETGLVPVKDFLLFTPDLTENETAVREWRDNVKSAPDGAIMQAMKSLDDNDDIKLTWASPNAARDRYLEHLKDTDQFPANTFPEPVINILAYVAKKVDWVATSFSNPLLTPSVMEEMPPLPLIKLTVKTRTASDARMLRNMLESSIGLGITAWRTAMMAAQAFDEDVPEMPQFLYEFVRGYTRTLLPVVEGDKLVFQMPEFGGRFWEIYSWTGIGLAVTLPAVQAARESARQQKIIGEDFDLYGKTMQDKDFDWNSYRGKYVLVKFTATWCGPCKMELPGMLEAYEKYHDKGLEIVSVYIWEADGDEGNDKVKKFVQNEEIPWTIISEPLTKKAEQPSQSDTFAELIDGVPTMLIVDKEGKVFAIETRGETLQKILKKLFDK